MSASDSNSRLAAKLANFQAERDAFLAIEPPDTVLFSAFLGKFSDTPRPFFDVGYNDGYENEATRVMENLTNLRSPAGFLINQVQSKFKAVREATPPTESSESILLVGPVQWQAAILEDMRRAVESGEFPWNSWVDLVRSQYFLWGFRYMGTIHARPVGLDRKIQIV